MQSLITIGADPEIFLTDMNSQRFISSIGKFGGTKTHPLSIGNDCFVQEDNVALEFNIKPSHSEQAFIDSLKYSLDELSARAQVLDLKLSLVASAHFDNDQLQHPRAKIFGCDPDYNAWTGRKNPRPQAKDKTLRAAGGHVHVGCNAFEAFEIGRALDLYLGVPSVHLDPDTERRTLYGRAGAVRKKSYGVEYRVLSNFWLKTTAFQRWVYQTTMAALEFLGNGNRLSFDDGEIIQQCINTSDTKLATKLMERYGLGLGTAN